MRTSCVLVFILIFTFFHYSSSVSKSARNSQKKRNFVIKTSRKQYIVRTANKKGSCIIQVFSWDPRFVAKLSLQRSQVENPELGAIVNYHPLTRLGTAQPGRGRGFRISQSDCLSAKGWTSTAARAGTASNMSIWRAVWRASREVESRRGGTRYYLLFKSFWIMVD